MFVIVDYTMELKEGGKGKEKIESQQNHKT
jgi:hypothetical protein